LFLQMNKSCGEAPGAKAVRDILTRSNVAPYIWNCTDNEPNGRSASLGLIYVITEFSRMHVRHTLRNIYKSHVSFPVDVVFAIGLPNRDFSVDDEIMIFQTCFEQSVNRDLILLNMPENMNHGKGYLAITTILDKIEGGVLPNYSYL